MPLQTRPALARAAVLAVLTTLLASCGGGTTGGPLPSTAAAPRTAAATSATAASGAAHASAPVASRRAAATRTTATVPPARRRAPAPPHAAPAGAAAPPAAVPAPTASAPTRRRVPAQPAAPKPAATSIDELAQLTLTNRASPAHYFQQGPVTGTFDGTISLEARITSRGVIVDFTATLPGGTITGHGIAIAVIDGSPTPGLRGTVDVTGGTGRFAGIHGRGLKVSGRAKPDASWARVRMSGAVAY